MPFALIIVGTVLLIAASRNKQDDLYTLVKGDFSGQNNYVFWVVSILLIGSVGYIEKLRPLSTAFLVLVILVLILARGNPSGVGGGLFQKFTQGLNATKTATTNAPAYGMPGSPFGGG
jgi:hypothetical protein